MAQKGVQLDRETFSCSVCLNLLKDPVTTPCGHSYCMDCIQGFWDQEDGKGKVPSCPECRQTYSPRPVLLKNTMLAVLVEEIKKMGLQADDDCYAGPGDVACDFCSGRKLKAHKSCLVCLVSYCESHLQPHYESPTFEKHKLVEPSNMLQENICPRHKEVMRMFCRTDQQCVCYLCPVDEHKGHDTVSAAAERAERQRELEVSRQNIQLIAQAREKDVKALEEKLEGVARSVDTALDGSEKIFTELVRLLEKSSSDVKQRVRSQQEAEVSRVKELQERLQQRIGELRSRDAELKELAETEDHSQFLKSYTSLSRVRESSERFDINLRPVRYIEEVVAVVSELRDKLQEFLNEEQANLPPKVVERGPVSREDFLKYYREITLDHNTANMQLALSEFNTRVTLLGDVLPYTSHLDRFTYFFQALSKESLTGRCYWEVSRKGRAYIGVAYKAISRGACSNESVIGLNNKSWALLCERGTYSFYYNGIVTPVNGPGCPRIGVYLDHSAGSLSFYSISHSMTLTLLHRVQTTFTQPLHAAIRLYNNYGDMVEFCKLK